MLLGGSIHTAFFALCGLERKTLHGPAPDAHLIPVPAELEGRSRAPKGSEAFGLTGGSAMYHRYRYCTALLGCHWNDMGISATIRRSQV